MTALPPSRHTFSLQQAVGAAPTLAALQERIRVSRSCLDQIQHLIPKPLAQHIQAGPIDEGEWCLLVSSAAASTKLRHMLPTLQRELTLKGAPITSIRLKIQTFKP
jgi:Dna[CI] antecedent, DciA